MDKTIKILAEVSGKSLRLDKFLAEKIKTLTRSQIKKIINSKGVRVNKKIVISASEKVKDRSEIEVLIETKGNNDYIEPKKIGLNIKWIGKGVKEKAINIENKKIILECRKRYFRPLEVDYLKGNALKAKKKLKWYPKISINNLIDEMIKYETKINDRT